MQKEKEPEPVEIVEPSETIQRRQHINSIIEELIQTEKGYLEDLEIMVQVIVTIDLFSPLHCIEICCSRKS